MEYYIAIKRNELLIYATAWVDFKGIMLCYKRQSQDFPGGPAVKNPPSNAGDAGSIPGRGTKIPHATEQLSPHATTKSPLTATKTQGSQIN